MRSVAFLGWLAGCQFAPATLPPGTPDVDAAAPDSQPGLPDADTSPDADTCAIHCEGANLVPCPPANPTACTLACVETAGAVAAHCGVYVPANGFSLAGTAETADVTYSTTEVVFNTDTGEITQCSPRVTLRAAGSVGMVVSGVRYSQSDSVGVFSMKTLTVSGDGVVRAIGARAFGLIAAGEVSLDGGSIRLSAGPRSKSLDDACLGTSTAAADRVFGGPGSGSGGAPDLSATGSGAGTTGDMDSEGAGGGAFAAAGGAGGKTGGAGGIVFGGAASPLRGGGGGAGGRSGNMACGGHGGGAGGTLQISTPVAIRVLEDEGIMANGAGGARGATGCGAGGGGAGGMIVLDAPVVEQAGFLSARGGGGGAGDCTDGENAGNSCFGEGPGSIALSGFGVVRFPGGAATGAGTDDPDRGGDGGGPGPDLFGLPGHPTNDALSAGGGGGGGAAGRIFIRTRAGGATTNNTRIAPPAAMGSIDVL